MGYAPDVKFDYDRSRLEAVILCRGWRNVLTMGGHRFAEELEKGILQAHMGRVHTLEKLLQNKGDAEIVARACTLHSEKNLANSGSSSDEDSDPDEQRG